MKSAIKMKNDVFISSEGITHEKKKLSDILNQKKEFSTTEKFINEYWIDGKKIYEKVLKLGVITISAGNNDYNHGISNIDTVVETIFQFKFLNWWYTKWDGINNIITKQTVLHIFAVSNLTVEDSFAVIRYTKTSD